MFLIGIHSSKDQKMGLRRIYFDNLIYKGVPGNTNLKFPENKCIYTQPDSDFYGLDYIFRELIPDLLVDDVRFNFINDEEVATIVIETDEGTYSKAVNPEGDIVFENLSSSSIIGKEEKDELLNLIKIKEFCRNVTSYTLTLTSICLPRYFSESPIKLFNSVIPLVFSEVSEVLNNGSAVIKGQIFPRDVMGGGYTQMLRILYAVWAAKSFKTHTIYLDHWYNRLHVLVRKWLWNEFFPKLDGIEGTLIIDNPDEYELGSAYRKP